jgi:hypothetical protein
MAIVLNLNNREIVFYGIRAATVAMQWFGNYVSTTGDGVFRGVRAKNERRYGSVLTSGSRVQNNHGISSTCEDLKCD